MTNSFRLSSTILSILVLPILVVGLAIAGLWLSGCGSDGDSKQGEQSAIATSTVRAEREHRQASIMQKQGQARQQGDQPAVDPEREGADAVMADELQPDQSDAADADAIRIPTEIDFGHRAGLPFARNVVGDPDAPVLLVEYSDFQ